MKMLGSLFQLSSCTSKAEGQFVAQLIPDSGHPVFQGHFPGRPITPGACLIQLALELAQHCFHVPMQLDTIKNVKFLRLIQPNNIETLSCILLFEASSSKLQTEFIIDKDVCSKMTFLLR